MRWIIDRFEENVAILENPETLEIKERPRADLPTGVKEGDVLIDDGGVLRLDYAETEARATRIRERFNRLKKH